MRRIYAFCFCLLLPALVLAEGANWESYFSFSPSVSGRVDAVAIFHNDTLFMLGGQPYRCNGVCNDPESGAADYLPPGASEWLQGAPFDDKLQGLGGGVDGHGRLVAFGGSNGPGSAGRDDTFIYDILLADQTEPTLARRNFTNTNFAWATDGSGRFYAIGGGPGADATAVNPNMLDVERYDAGSDSWTVLASLPQGRASAAAVYDGQGHILLIGGYDEFANTRLASILSYDIAADTWSTLTDLPSPGTGDNNFSDQRAAMGANGKIYIVGGINGPIGAGSASAQVYTYEPVTATWDRAPDLSVPRQGHAVAVDSAGWLYALGGRSTVIGLSSTERLDTSPVGGECVEAQECSDGLACNGQEFCVDGQCLAGETVICNAGEFCGTGGACRVQRFDIVDLTASLDGASGTANAINNSSHVVGEYFDSQDGQWHGFEFDGAVTRDLGPGRARAISDDGWIAGENSTAFAIDPLTGDRIDLGTLGGTSSAAQGITTDGWVVGQSGTASGDSRAFLVPGVTEPMQDLGTLGDYSIAHGVSPEGLVVGESLVTHFDPHAEPFTFDGTAPGATIAVMGGVYSAGSARAISDLGHITGWVSHNVDNWGNAFIFDGELITELPDIPGKSYSIGTAINNLGQVVGYGFGEWVNYPCCGMVWSNGIHRAYFYDGLSAVNLNDELPESSGWLLTLATGVNDKGEIVGTGTFNGSGRAFMLVPHDSAPPDQDGDGIPDSADNCPATTNSGQENSDGDSRGDVCDNCTEVDNEDQLDTDFDDFGNLCDADFDNSGFTNRPDFQYFIGAWRTADPHADFNQNGIVDKPDLITFRSLFLTKPGPSGIAP